MQVSYRGDSYARPDYTLAERNKDSATYSPVIYSSKVVTDSAHDQLKMPTYEERINSVLREGGVAQSRPCIIKNLKIACVTTILEIVADSVRMFFYNSAI